METERTRKRKRIWISVVTVAVVVALTLVALVHFGILPLGKGNEDDEMPVDEYIRIIQKNYDTRIYLCGTDIAFPKDLRYTCVASVSEAVASPKGEYTVIIVNNLKRQYELTEDEYNELSEYSQVDNQAVMILGENIKRQCFMKAGTGAVVSGSLGSMYYKLHGEIVECTGFWDEEGESYVDTYDQNISTALTWAIADFIKDRNSDT